MSAHIDRDCKSDPAEERRRKIFNNKCSLKGCKNKEIIPFLCQNCNRNYCIRHRHETDHECDLMKQQSKQTSNNSEINNRRLQFFQKQPSAAGAAAAQSSYVRTNTVTTTNNNNNRQLIQPSSMSDKEALDYALRLSLAESNKQQSTTSASNINNNNREAETEDEILARVMAQSALEYNSTTEEKKDNCSIN